MSFKLLLPLAWTLTFGFLGELLLEYRAASRGYSTLFIPISESYQHTPTLDGTTKAKVEWGPTSDFPFRSKILSKEDLQKNLCIWIASSSHGEDSRLPVQSIFPNLISTHLTDCDLDADVINASKAGFTVANNQEALQISSSRYSPDFVLLYQGVNDLKVITRPFDHTTSSQPSVLIPPNGLSISRPIENLLEKCTVYTLIKTNASTHLTACKQLRKSISRDEDQQYFSSIENFITCVNHLGSTPVLCTFAMSHSSEISENLPLDYQLGMLAVNKELEPTGWIDTVERWNRMIKQYAADNHIGLIDLAEVIHGKPEYFRDAHHFNKLGHAKVAGVIAKYLKSVIESKGVADEL